MFETTPTTPDTVTAATTPARSVQGAAITSLAMSVPSGVVTNASIAERLGVDDEWIVKRTGIRSRHVATPDERLTDIAAGAGAAALAEAGLDATELDLVLVATTTADELLPNAAPRLAHALGAVRAGAIDIGAACTGFLSGLSLATAQIEAGRATNVLLVGADFMTRMTDPDDRSTAAVFGDGAGAVLLTATSGDGRVGPVTLGADGGLGPELIVAERTDALIRMQGQATFKHAVMRLVESTRHALELAELGLDEIDLFVYHQANGRILRAVGEALDLPTERVIDCIATYGNTSAATIPIALAHARAEGRLNPGDRVLLSAFGAGLTWGAVVVEWGAPPELPLITRNPNGRPAV